MELEFLDIECGMSSHSSTNCVAAPLWKRLFAGTNAMTPPCICIA